ncbi:SDR family NAD(P)-dependent oxidoreductase [Pseudooceanicola sp.]|uniref:SDR family NAD(P)-dependent oxidoreductase n=1 Tax=Pseudooceanicola sp. TaxID=1914328 RepID=UPI00261EAE78|nr:SDR family NAD(P)-dependent oxidoreductase [Pseudooceanicola sp.]MDF1856702.1 SDR family NAD(P)-dependent oxidoreductase [Pseudooceanicola sp.]
MHVVITGASRGIGAALAGLYRAEGHTVTGTSRSGAGGLIAADLSDMAGIAALAAAVEDRPVDLLICNAGLYLDRDEALDTGYPAAMWAEQFTLNVTAPFLCTQALLPNLRAARGKLAIISSQMGSSTQATGTALIYRSSKAAVLNLGLNLSAALKPDGIAVGIYHPGWVRTDMGGAGADISTDEAASGLAARFAGLDLASTGAFQTWDGRDHPI